MSDFKVIDNTAKARDEFGHCYGSEIHEISREDLVALLTGKMLAATVNGDEYSIFIRLGDGVE